MGLLGRKRGRGKVEVNGKIVGMIDYEVDVWLEERSGLKSATGTSSGDGDVLEAVFEAGGAALHLQDGGTARFMVTHIQAGDAELRFSGPIPGY